MHEVTFIDSGPLLADEIMEKDRQLLATLDPSGPSIIHFYRWATPSATFGYFATPSQFLDMDAIDAANIRLARRPTGGGILFHLTDLAFSVLVPAGHPRFSQSPLQNYHWINGAVQQVISAYHPELSTLLSTEPLPKTAACRFFCLAKPTQYDVLLGDKKIAGAAQRKTKAGFLHQGSISIAPMDRALLKKVLLPHPAVFEAIAQESRYLLEEPFSDEALNAMRLEISSSLKTILQETLRWKVSSP